MAHTDAILARLLRLHPKLIDLELGRMQRLLEALGRPQDRVPPVIHVAGTNGKGSTIAFLRAFLEAAGRKVHVYTSPHLVHFRERIRLAGTLVSDLVLERALEDVEAANGGLPVTFFEVTTAAAFKLFAEAPADFLLLETGMGGEFDATNIIDKPFGTIITPVALDHQQYLGETVEEIAKAKAGILKPGTPAAFGPQQRSVLDRVLLPRARRLGVIPIVAGEDFQARLEDGRLVYFDETGMLDLPPPRLVGPHQVENAALAIAAARAFGLPLDEAAFAKGLRSAQWPARLAPLHGLLEQRLTPAHELWLDGGHNAHGAEALSRALAEMHAARPAPLVLIVGMMNTRSPEDFFAPFVALRPDVFAVPVPGEAKAHPAEAVAEGAQRQQLRGAAMPSLEQALGAAREVAGARIIICGSLYLAGPVLEANGTVPQ